MPSFAEKLGTRVRELMAERGWTREDLESNAKRAPRSLEALIQGRHEPRASVLRDVAAAFGISCDELLTFPADTGQASVTSRARSLKSPKRSKK